MAYRRRSSGRRRSYSRPRRSYSGSRRRTSRSYGRRGGAGQTLRLVLQQPGARPARPPFGSFMPQSPEMIRALFAQGMFQPNAMAASAPGPGQGFAGGPPGARMVLNPAFRTPPGYKLVPENEVDGGGAELADNN